uniref:Uncharacterized protein n=1 Tax=Anguilla anguilla TaxID=7936 RepID=A0A0E9U1W2_ANGAN
MFFAVGRVCIWNLMVTVTQEVEKLIPCVTHCLSTAFPVIGTHARLRSNLKGLISSKLEFM